MSAIDGKIILTKNPCYKVNKKMTPKGIVVHSTGANNPYLKRYIAPDDGVIGKNAYGNDWNRSSTQVCVHGFIGKDKNDKVKFYQTLPFNVCCWGVGGGSKGSYNYNPPYIQFEMCEDGLKDKKYAKACYDKAVDVCVYLCQKYNISYNNIVSHHEAYLKGYGSNHGDPHNWWDKHGFTMKKFRADVKSKLSKPKKPKKVKLKKNASLYTKAYKDLVGGNSKPAVKLSKGATIEWISDDKFGWSKVKYAGKYYYVLNGNISKTGLSKHKKVTLGKEYTGIKVTDDDKKGSATKFKKGLKVTVVCVIEGGTYKGWSYVKYKKKKYYIKGKLI